jgi:hypothetical protein
MNATSWSSASALPSGDQDDVPWSPSWDRARRVSRAGRMALGPHRLVESRRREEVVAEGGSPADPGQGRC